MRAAIYDPYLDTGGGGERYILTSACALAKDGWDVELSWKDPKILKWLITRLGIDLSNVEIVPDISRGAGYDLVFWLSDGSIPLLFGGKNILHFQTPFIHVSGRNIVNRVKFLKIHDIVCNSKFTKSFIDREYGVSSQVLYPPVATAKFISGKKEKIILYVGRFSKLQQEKRQDILINVFKDMSDRGKLTGWQLIIAGGSDVGAGNMVSQLKEESRGYPVKILENLPFLEIQKLYAKARIFWSASGFNVDEQKNPEKVEHFGITVVEAMTAGCIPVITSKGGHKEIVAHGKNGFLWENLDELEQTTLDLINNERGIVKIAKEAEKRARDFSEEKFGKRFLEIIK